MVNHAGDRTMKLIKDRHALKLAIVMSFITLIMILAYGFMSWKSWENVQSVTKNTNEVEGSLFINFIVLSPAWLTTIHYQAAKD